MDIKTALEKYDWLKDYLWKLVSKDKDEYTKKVAKTSAAATSCASCQDRNSFPTTILPYDYAEKS
jgi:hypothetical protein